MKNGWETQASAPIEQEVAAIAHEHLAVVEVVVLDRLGQAVPGQLVAHLLDPRHVPFETAEIVRRELDEIVEHLLEARRQRGEAQIGDTEGDQLVGMICQVDLQPRVQRQDVQPARQVSLALDDLAQSVTCVGHEHPAAFQIDGQQRRHAVGSARRDQRDRCGLVPKRSGVRLEVDVTALGRHTHHRRPGPHVVLVDRPDSAEIEPRHLGTDPLVCLREPQRIRPFRHAGHRTRDELASRSQRISPSLSLERRKPARSSTRIDGTFTTSQRAATEPTPGCANAQATRAATASLA